MKKTLLSLLLLAALLLSLFPFAALAEEPAEGETEEPAEESREGLGNLWGLPADDVLFLGVYKDKPVPWLVLDADQTNMGTEGVYLFSRDLIDSTLVRFDESSTLWEGSLAQEWCTQFAENAFSEAESALVAHTDQIEPATYPDKLFDLTWREVELKGEQVFFLSVQELAKYYGIYSTTNKRTVKRCSMESYYWLRSPHYYHDDYHGIVLQDSYIHDKLPYEPWAARPCANLYIQDAVWVLPADDGGALGAAPLPAQQEREIHEWKLIVPLAEHSFRAETTAAENGELTVAYSGADVGEGARLTLLVRDAEGKPLSLRRLVQPAAAEGSLSLQLQDLALPEGAALFLFCEQLNGATRSNTASPLQALATEVQTPREPTVPAAEAETSVPDEQAEPAQDDPAPAAEAPSPALREDPAPDSQFAVLETPALTETAETPAPTEAPETAENEAAGETENLPEGGQDNDGPGQPSGERDASRAEETDEARARLWTEIQDYALAVFLALFLLLAVVLLVFPGRRHGVKPLILLILLGLLLAVIYLRLVRGELPEDPFPFLKDLL